MPHQKFLLKLPGQALRALRRKAHLGNPRARASPALDVFDPACAARPGLIERDRKLLGLLSQTAYAAILKTFQALFDRSDVRPGCVISLQTFVGYGANFNPHAYALVSDGVFTPEGEFLPMPSLDTATVMEVL
jgi:hypothetical protein